MPNSYRYRKGDCQKVPFPTENLGVAPSSYTNLYPMEIGDLMYQHPLTGSVRSASNFPYQGSVSATQSGFAGNFAGVCSQKRGTKTGEIIWKLPTSIDPGYVEVDTSGIFEYDCAYGIAWRPGSPVGVYCTTAGIPNNQQVAYVPTYDRAIGVAVVPQNALGSTTTMSNGFPVGGSSTLVNTILVDIRSAVMGRGLFNAAADAGDSGSGA